jgi:hypothetical protein
MQSASGVRLAQESFSKRRGKRLTVAVGYRLERCEFTWVESHGYLRLPLADVCASPVLGLLMLG